MFDGVLIINYFCDTVKRADEYFHKTLDYFRFISTFEAGALHRSLSEFKHARTLAIWSRDYCKLVPQLLVTTGDTASANKKRDPHNYCGRDG